MSGAVLFDLDGTLVDSAPGIHAAAGAMLRDLGRSPLPPEETRGYIGDGISRFLKRVLTRQWWGEPDGELLSRAGERMFFHYGKECVVGGRVYDGVEDTLAALSEAGVAMACVTNKPAQFTAPLLAACGLARFFGAVISGDTLAQKKPDPAPLLAACKRLGKLPRRSLMVGDSLADSRAAAAARCRFVAVSYGYHRALPPADRVIESFPMLVEEVLENGYAGNFRQ